MRNWIDQLRVRARVVIVILASAIVIIEIAKLALRSLAKLSSKTPSVRHGGERFACQADRARAEAEGMAHADRYLGPIH